MLHWRRQRIIAGGRDGLAAERLTGTRGAVDGEARRAWRPQEALPAAVLGPFRPRNLAPLLAEHGHDHLSNYEPGHDPSERMMRVMRVEVRGASIINGSQQDPGGIQREESELHENAKARAGDGKNDASRGSAPSSQDGPGRLLTNRKYKYPGYGHKGDVSHHQIAVFTMAEVARGNGYGRFRVHSHVRSRVHGVAHILIVAVRCGKAQQEDTGECLEEGRRPPHLTKLGWDMQGAWRGE